MKNTLPLLVIALSCFFGSAQSVEKSIFSFQTGPFGLWVNHELRLSPSFVLRNEIGYENVIISRGQFYNGKKPIAYLAFTIAPRYYYNLAKRDAALKETFNNSGNFFALAFRLYPEFFVITTEKKTSALSNGYIIPTWGIRRNIGIHFNYELGFGIGFDGDTTFGGKPVQIRPELHLRIGYHIW